MTSLALTDIAICLWLGALFGFGVGRYFRLRSTYKGRKQTAQHSNVFPMDRSRDWRSTEQVLRKFSNGTDEIPF